MRRAVVVIAAAVVLVAVLAAMRMQLEDALLYFPTRELAAGPERYGLPAEVLEPFAADGVKLHGWWIRGNGRRAVVFFHGNAGNAADRLDRVRQLHDRFGLDVFLVDYRGYGRSEGSPSEEGLRRDTRAIYESARAKGFPAGKIVLFGESLGSAVAAGLAAERACEAVVLETPFLSIRAMARHHYPLVPPILVRTRFDNAEAIARVSAPKLFLVAGQDDVVPPEQSLRLFALAPEPKTLFVIPGASHNDTYEKGGEAYWKALGDFLGSLPETP